MNSKSNNLNAYEKALNEMVERNGISLHDFFANIHNSNYSQINTFVNNLHRIGNPGSTQYELTLIDKMNVNRYSANGGYITLYKLTTKTTSFHFAFMYTNLELELYNTIAHQCTDAFNTDTGMFDKSYYYLTSGFFNIIHANLGNYRVFRMTELYQPFENSTTSTSVINHFAYNVMDKLSKKIILNSADPLLYKRVIPFIDNTDFNDLRDIEFNVNQNIIDIVLNTKGYTLHNCTLHGNALDLLASEKDINVDIVSFNLINPFAEIDVDNFILFDASDIDGNALLDLNNLLTVLNQLSYINLVAPAKEKDIIGLAAAVKILELAYLINMTNRISRDSSEFAVALCLYFYSKLEYPATNFMDLLEPNYIYKSIITKHEGFVDDELRDLQKELYQDSFINIAQRVANIVYVKSALLEALPLDVSKMHLYAFKDYLQSHHFNIFNFFNEIDTDNRFTSSFHREYGSIVHTFETRFNPIDSNDNANVELLNMYKEFNELIRNVPKEVVKDEYEISIKEFNELDFIISEKASNRLKGNYLYIVANKESKEDLEDFKKNLIINIMYAVLEIHNKNGSQSNTDITFADFKCNSNSNIAISNYSSTSSFNTVIGKNNKISEEGIMDVLEKIYIKEGGKIISSNDYLGLDDETIMENIRSLATVIGL